MVRVRRLRGLGGLAARRHTKNVRDDVARLGGLSLRLHLHRDLHVRQRLGVGVVFGVLAETLHAEERGQPPLLHLRKPFDERTL